MTQPQDPGRPSLGFQVSDLFARYLRQQIEAQAEGLGFSEPSEEVIPHDATPVQPVDPKMAWNNCLAAAKYLASATLSPTWTVPPEWPNLVASQEPALSLSFALGNFPQLVRNLQPLLAGERSVPVSLPTRPIEAPALLAWTEGQKSYPQVLLAAGVLRLARHFDRAEKLLANSAPAEWEVAQANERAALAWHRGECDKALQLWQGLPDSVPVLFNRGMAALFLKRSAEAREALTRAISGLPETSAWHHLAQLYLALASLQAG